MSTDLEGWLIASIVSEVGRDLRLGIYSNQWSIGTDEWKFYDWSYKIMGAGR